MKGSLSYQLLSVIFSSATCIEDWDVEKCSQTVPCGKKRSWIKNCMLSFENTEILKNYPNFQTPYFSLGSGRHLLRSLGLAEHPSQDTGSWQVSQLKRPRSSAHKRYMFLEKYLLVTSQQLLMATRNAPITKIDMAVVSHYFQGTIGCTPNSVPHGIYCVL